MSSNLDAKVGGSTKQYESRNKTAKICVIMCTG